MLEVAQLRRNNTQIMQMGLQAASLWSTTTIEYQRELTQAMSAAALSAELQSANTTLTRQVSDLKEENARLRAHLNQVERTLASMEKYYGQP